MLGVLETDIDIIEIDEHIGHWCDSGHKPPILFRREGPESPELPTRFFHVRVKSGGIDRIICEPCLIITNHMARLKKEGKL